MLVCESLWKITEIKFLVGTSLFVSFRTDLFLFDAFRPTKKLMNTCALKLVFNLDRFANTVFRLNDCFSNSFNWILHKVFFGGTRF